MEFEVISNARAHAIMAPEVERVLGPSGFEAVGDLKWVCGERAPIRYIFAFAKWKGGKMAPRWGVSLDFVPHVSGGQVRWHRSNRSAMPDLCIDAWDRALDVTYIYGEEPISREHARVIGSAAKAAEEFWANCSSLSELPRAITWLRQYLAGDERRFYSHAQHPLAAAFVAAKTGRRVEAETELERVTSHPRLHADARRRLQSLLADAMI